MKKSYIFLTLFISLLALCFLSSCRCNHNYKTVYENNEKPEHCGWYIYKQEECTKCGDIRTSNNEIVCQFEEIKLAECSCNQIGITIRRCIYCGENECYNSQNKNLIEEYFIELERKDATCQSSGYIKRECKDCKEIIYDYLPPLYHSVENIGNGRNVPNCTQPAYKPATKCINCGCQISDIVITKPAVGHNYVNGVCVNPLEGEGMSPNKCSSRISGYIRLFDGDEEIRTYHPNPSYLIIDYYELEKPINIDLLELIDKDFLPNGRFEKTGYVFKGFYTKEGLRIDQINVDYVKEHYYLDFYAEWEKSGEIKTLEDFLSIKDNPSKSYVLMNDINLKGEIIPSIDNFKGVLDGNGFTIKNFSLNANTVNKNYGLFNNNEGTIKNLKLSDFTFNVNLTTTTSSSIGVIAGTNNGTIENVSLVNSLANQTYNIHNSNITSYFGTLVGTNKGTISNCDVNIDTDYKFRTSAGENGSYTENFYTNYILGGLVGLNEGEMMYCNFKNDLNIEARASGTFVDAFVDFTYYANSNNTIGGLVGKNTNTILKCFADANINYNNSSLYLAKDQITIGGISGDNSGSIHQTYFIGSIKGGGKNGTNIGGMTGLNSGKISDSYTNLDIIPANDINNADSSFGGFVAKNSSEISNCYSNGSITSTIKSYTGGFIAQNSGSINYCFSLTNLTAVSGTAGKFVGNDTNIIKDSYVINSSLFNPGTSTVNAYEISTIDFKTLLSYTNLTETLKFNKSTWCLDSNSEPYLNFELKYGHNYGKAISFEPTCSDPGLTMYNCVDCGKVFFTNFVAPITHRKFGDALETVEATHTKPGYAIYNCEDGHTYKEILAPTGHIIPENVECDNEHLSHKNDKYYYECDCGIIVQVLSNVITHTEIEVKEQLPDCYTSTEGNLEGIKCEKCDIILSGCEIVPPHSYELKETITESTCKELGLGLYECSICQNQEEKSIPLQPHTYIDKNFTCSICSAVRYSIDDSYYPISSYEDLLNININPSGKYYLTNDIDLNGIDFEPLCSIDYPFSGVLLGNGFSIKNLTLNSNSKLSAFILYNNGTIAGLDFKDTTLSITNQKESTSSIICGYNNGMIYNCDIVGNTIINLTASFVSDSTESVSKSFEYIFGGITAINQETGIISDCNVLDNYTYNLKAEAILNSTYLANYIQKLLSVSSVTNNTTITSGGICGINNGKIINTVFNPTYIDNYSIVSKTTGINRGKTYLYLVLNDGVFVGINSGEITDSKSITSLHAFHTKDLACYLVDAPNILLGVVLTHEYINVTDNKVFEKYNNLIGLTSDNSYIENLEIIE